MLGWFKALMPREDGFFNLFARHSRTLVAAAEALQGVLEGGEAVPRHCQIIVDREHEADAITAEVLLAARRTSAVRWSVASSIVVAWVLTLPAAGLVAATCYGLTTLIR